MQETDIIYNLLTYLNSSKEEDVYYSIALTMVQNLDIIPRCSINELADLCYTSTATISRFCRKFGYSSFPQFKSEMAYGLEQAKHEVFLDDSEKEYIDKNPNHVIDKVYDLVLETLILGKKSLRIAKIDELCQLIHEAKKVHFFGYQFNKIVASDLQLKFIKLGKFIYAFADHGDDSQKIELLSEESLAIVMSVSGKIGHQHLMEEIHQRGAKIVLITMNPETPLADLVDYLFVIDGLESNFTVSSISGSIGFLTALNIVYIRYGLLYPKK